MMIMTMTVGEPKGAIHSTKIQTGPNGKSGPPQMVDHFFKTFLHWPNRSIEFWTEISGNFGWMDRAPRLSEISYTYDPSIYDIASDCRVAALFWREAPKWMPDAIWFQYRECWEGKKPTFPANVMTKQRRL